MIIVAVYLTYTAILVYFGFLFRRPNWLGWVMFTRASFIYPQIMSGDREINIWDYLPHGKVILDKNDIDALLNYLRHEHGLHPLSGEVVFETNAGKLKYTVRNGWLI